jgi:arylsulfatase A-like enzyme
MYDVHGACVCFLGEELLLHVPLAVRVPGGTPGIVIDTPVQIFDLLPTFLDFANASNYLCSLSNVTGYVQFGNSLKPWLFGGQPLPNETHSYVFAEGGYLYQNEIEYNDPTQTADFKNPHFIYWPRVRQACIVAVWWLV